MLRAYFDTNVYDAIEKGNLHGEDVEAIRVALKRREIVAPLSLSDIEELLGQWDTDRPATIRRLRVAGDLVGFDGILKQPSDLLRDAIQAYVAGTAAPSPLLPRQDRRILATYLSRLVRGYVSHADELTKVVAAVHLNKERFGNVMLEGRDQTLAEWKTLHPENPAVTFAEYFASGADRWAEDFAVPLGLAQACRDLGLKGLLEVRPVRLAVGALMSLVFSQIIGDGPQQRQPAWSDYYDLWHALTASVADVFVTFDERLAGSLARVPVDGFRVVTSLRALLDDPTLAR